MDLPVMPTVKPMLCKSAKMEQALALLRSGHGLIEPKWDGFRCLAARAGADVTLYSRHGKPLARYFPEVVESLRALPGDGWLLDGELLAWRDGQADFGALMARLHPAASRVAVLARETPASFVAFDLVTGEPFAARRRALEALLRDGPPNVCPTPSTTDPAEAARWLDAPPGGALDGVVAKRADLAYQPGKRAMVKVKRVRTADCVVAGMRVTEGAEKVSSLLLGVWDGAELRHVGVAQKAAAVADLVPYVTPLAGHPWERGFALEGGHMGRLRGAAGRWAPGMSLDWVPLRPALVAEVAYTILDGIRFRHPVRVVRWRPDRDPRSCTVEQLA
jgi:ATP-dependent DNA ligase